jgi:hypothetical protein
MKSRLLLLLVLLAATKILTSLAALGDFLLEELMVQNYLGLSEVRFYGVDRTCPDPLHTGISEHHGRVGDAAALIEDGYIATTEDFEGG